MPAGCSPAEFGQGKSLPVVQGHPVEGQMTICNAHIDNPNHSIGREQGRIMRNSESLFQVRREDDRNRVANHLMPFVLDVRWHHGPSLVIHAWLVGDAGRRAVLRRLGTAGRRDRNRMVTSLAGPCTAASECDRKHRRCNMVWRPYPRRLLAFN